MKKVTHTHTYTHTDITSWKHPATLMRTHVFGALTNLSHTYTVDHWGSRRVSQTAETC